MKTRGMLLLLLVLFSVAAAAQMAAPAKPSTPPDMATVLNRQLTNLENELVPAADAMPADKYNYQTTKDTMSFGNQVRHAAATNYFYGSGILGEKPPVDLGKDGEGPELKTKAEIMQFLKDSFVYAHKAFSSVNESNATQFVANGRATRLGIAFGTIGHGNSHYGQIVQYLRLNGIVPPASRPR